MIKYNTGNFYKFNIVFINNCNYNYKDDKRYALVQWKNGKVNVVPMADFVRLSDNETDYKLESEYKVLFGSSRYPAIVKFIGTQPECYEKESDLIVEYSNDDTLRKNIKKNPSAKIVNDNLHDLKTSNKIDLLQTKVEELEIKLADSNSKLSALENENKHLKDELETLKNTNQSKYYYI